VVAEWPGPAGEQPVFREPGPGVAAVSWGKPACRFVSRRPGSLAVASDLLAQVVPPGVQRDEVGAQVVEL